MNIVYIAPMFHTNQVPIVKGWLEHNHNVTFICHYKGKTENHEYCTPYVLGYSKLFKLIEFLHAKLQSKSKRLSSYPEAFKDRFGFPSVIKLSRLLKKSQPHAVILRERSLYSIFAYLVCKFKKIKCILYNQTPLWDNEPPRNDFAHKIVKALTPSVRMTPVLGQVDAGYLDKKAAYIPFVIEPRLSPDEKTYFTSEQINLLCVGKYEERKNHLMLLKIVNRLLPKYPLHLTIVGEASTEYHKKHLKLIKDYITEHNLEDNVTLHVNCKPKNMADFYRNADLFILPSTGEFASVSQLEAMSYSLPVIISDTNGTSCYIENGKNGYLFQDMDESNLEEQLLSLLSSKEDILSFGAYSYQMVVKKYNFTNYKKSLEMLIRPL